MLHEYLSYIILEKCLSLKNCYDIYLNQLSSLIVAMCLSSES